MKTTVNIFRTLLLAVLTLTFGACGEDSLLSELGLDGQTSTKTDGAGEVWDGEVDTSWYQADATEFQIATAEQLAGLAKLVNAGYTFEGKTIKLTADILLNNTEGWENWGSNAPANSWTPIGNSWENQFTGTLDGDGYSVSGIYINSEADIQGLVGYLGSGGALQNLGVKASYIKGVNSVGGLCGRNDGTVTNCYNAGSVTGTGSNVGGLCGQNYATVTNCYNTGSVAGNRYVGGLCGWNYVTVTNCYNSGSVEGNYSVGGVCGNSWGNVTNCYYLDTCGAAGEGTSKTAKQFQSGEVAWLLQGEKAEQVWGQTIGTDGYPVPTSDASKKVYAYTMYQGQSTETGYANNNGNVDLDLASHPNTIAVFEASGTFAGKNIVVKDGDSYTCAELVLTDGADFYTPVKFTATKATYTRSPKVWATNDGSGSGWETLCLPFSGTLYADDVAKQPVLTDLAGDYWLRSLTDFKTPNTLIFASGSTATAADHQIEAGVPYIIALPGETFGGESLEGQTISVRGTGVTVLTTAARIQPEGSGLAFTGTFATKACDAASYRLNSENGSDGAGNLFVLDTELTDLAPFRCRIDVTGLNIGGASTRSASGLPKELRIGQ
ncbi:GLUG motif-containing protein [Bacteroides togonis]|uniref:GLUG motif-containing protein n=1 Tax=Bacteroides togonis TaxID=1917883 RepID=UPI00094AEDA9|nr:GLUG motif-containing protein [Bacteroides togonis]